MTTGLRWIREDTPRWDADKQRIFGPTELAATGLAAEAAARGLNYITTWCPRPAPARTGSRRG